MNQRFFFVVTSIVLLLTTAGLSQGRIPTSTTNSSLDVLPSPTENKIPARGIHTHPLDQYTAPLRRQTPALTEFSAKAESLNTVWVRNYGTGLAPSDDDVSAMVVDDSGNVYITGISDGGLSLSDYLTIKYNENGDTLWTRRFNGSSNLSDSPVAIAVDHSGAVYVTGTSYIADTQCEILTIKYKGNGDLIWIQSYREPGSQRDRAVALNIDSMNNIVVAGYFLSTETGDDYITIKYNEQGTMLWRNIFNSKSDQDDCVTGQTIDRDGNIVVTGYSWADSLFEFSTIKYRANGDTAWIRHYSGSTGPNDRAQGLVVDDSGNVFVAGNRSQGTNRYNITIIKYNSVGDTLWVRQYLELGDTSSFASAISVQHSGSVIVSGIMKGSYGYIGFIAVQYNSQGELEWERKSNMWCGDTYHNVFHGIDDSGNVYLNGVYRTDNEGEKILIVKYSPGGDTAWTRLYNKWETDDVSPASFSVDHFGNAYCVTSVHDKSGWRDMVTLKYDPDGDSLWQAHYKGTGISHDCATHMVTDRSGNVYVTGYGTGPDTTQYFTTIKYNALGDTLWTARYLAGNRDYLLNTEGLAIDASGNVFITGSTIDSTRSPHIVTIKYDNNGNEVWQRIYHELTVQYSLPSALELDYTGNVLVTGSGYRAATSEDYLILKYTTDGTLVWDRKYNGEGNGDDRTVALSLDTVGNVYVTGYAAGAGTGDDIVTMKYSPDGDSLWLVKYSGPGTMDDYPRAMAVDDSGNVYGTGTSHGLNPVYLYTMIKYSPSGSVVWEKQGTKVGSRMDYPVCLKLDKWNNIYLAGTSTLAADVERFWAAKFNNSGDTVWMQCYGSGYSFAKLNSMAIDNSGNIYLTGYGNSRGYGYSSVMLQYHANGREGWIQDKYEGDITFHCLNMIAIGSLGDLYTTGYIRTGSTSFFSTIKYFQIPDAVIEQPVGIPTATRLQQNYPNPFNPSTRLSFVVGRTSLVTLTVFDLMGREVAKVLKDVRIEAGSYEIPYNATDLASGIYLYRLEAATVSYPKELYTEVKKMVLLH